MTSLFLILWVVTILLHIFTKIRAKKTAREREKVLEYLEEGVLGVDVQELIVHVNYRACKILGISKSKLLGKPLATFCAHVALGKALHLVKESKRHGTILTDTLSSEKGALDLICVPRSKREGSFLILQDKSAQPQVVKLGKDFIANASHELRTPITIIKGFAETLQEMKDLPREMVQEIMEKIIRSSERMEMLVKNLLTLADLENLPALRFEKCDLIVLVENCKHLLLVAHPNVRVRVEKKMAHLTLRLDRDIFELALMNLLENAVKYSQDPAEICIKIEEEANKITLMISDKGIGIAQDHLDKIFVRFYTVDKARARKLGGAGLGLSIVKTVVEKHEGEIMATSQLGRGSTFTIQLPHFA